MTLRICRLRLTWLCLAFCCSLAASAAIVPRAASAAGFSAPVELPQSSYNEWHFAVNDRGEGGAVIGTIGGAMFYRLQASCGLGEPIALSVPGGFAATSQSIAVNAHGRVAVALLYRDAT